MTLLNQHPINDDHISEDVHNSLVREIKTYMDFI